MVEDIYYYDKIASEPSEELAGRRDQEMLEAYGVSSCEVIIEPWPVNEGATDDEGNAAHAEILDYGDLGLSDESGEELPARASKTAPSDEQEFNAWKSNYDQWFSSYKIPFKQHDRVCEKGRNDFDEARACGSRSSEYTRKCRNDVSGRKPRDYDAE